VREKKSFGFFFFAKKFLFWLTFFLANLGGASSTNSIAARWLIKKQQKFRSRRCIAFPIKGCLRQKKCLRRKKIEMPPFYFDTSMYVCMCIFSRDLLINVTQPPKGQLTFYCCYTCYRGNAGTALILIYRQEIGYDWVQPIFLSAKFANLRHCPLGRECNQRSWVRIPPRFDAAEVSFLTSYQGSPTLKTQVFIPKVNEHSPLRVNFIPTSHPFGSNVRLKKMSYGGFLKGVRIVHIWDRCYDFKIYFRRKFQRKNWRFWLRTELKYAKFWS
jgi:hypothetical protein